jgi:hypothetical protein
MIGIAISVVWIFLIIFAVSAMYSMQDMQFKLGAPEITTTPDNEFSLSFPLYVMNPGLYNIANLNFTTQVFSRNGSEVAWGSTLVPIIPRGQAVNTTHIMSLNLTGLLQNNMDLLLNDSTLNVNENASMSAAEVVPVKASSSFYLPWGAPLDNLTFSTPETSVYNASYMRVVVPVSFENHAFFNLTGTLNARISNISSVVPNFLSSCKVNLNVPQNSPCRVNLEFEIPIQTTPSIHLEVFFKTQFFKYGPVVIDFGS